MKNRRFLIPLLTVLCLICLFALVSCSKEEPHTHTITHHAAVEATCTADGHLEYWECADCGKLFSDASGNAELADLTSITSPALNHILADTWSADDTGHWKNCTREGCGAECEKELHSYGENDICSCDYAYKDVGLEFTLSNETYIVTNYKGTAAKVGIPSRYKGFAVTGIGDKAFSDCGSLLTVAIPASVESIGNSAFRFCDSLIAVEFGVNSQLTSIGNLAFADCDRLLTITIPEHVRNIGSGAFSCCFKLIEVYNLSSLAIRTNSTDYGHAGLYAKNVYTDTTVPSKRFNDSDGYIFYDDGTNRYLLDYIGTDTALTLPANCNGHNYEIYTHAFYQRDDLASIIVPAGITGIGWYAFDGCSGLITAEFDVNSQLTSIGTGAFRGCGRLTTIAIPASVTCIEINPFEGCHMLTTLSVEGESDNAAYYVAGNCLIEKETGTLVFGFADSVIPADGSVKSIGASAFADCNSLFAITVPDEVTSIGDNAFFSCDNLTTVAFGANSQLASIGYAAFSNCNNLTTLTIPDGLTSIDSQAFRGCLRLIQKEGGVSYVSKWIIACDTDVTSVTLRADTVGIGYSAFYNCDNLTGVSIPASVTRIGDLAFWGCDSLTTVEFDIYNQLVSIGSEAFYSCDSLTAVNFGVNSQLTSIGDRAYAYCYSLSSVTIPEGLTSIGHCAFESCNVLSSVVFENPNGWWYARFSTDVSGIVLSYADLSNPISAASHLRSTYCDYYWFRS